MALSGSFTGSIVNGKYTLRVDWSATQNVAGNYSKITADIYLVIASGWSLRVGSRANTAAIAGTSYSWTAPEIYKSGSTTKLATIKTGKITHDTEGKKSVSISVTYNVAATISGTTYSTITANKTVELSQIPRATQPTLSASSANMGSKVTINMPRASKNFTHDLAYSFGSSSTYTSIATSCGTSYEWTVPDLAKRIPNATSDVIRIQCVTRNSSGDSIGTRNVILTAKVPTTVAYMPSISKVEASEKAANLATYFDVYIQGKSQIGVVITAIGAAGSTITKYSTTFAGKTYTGKAWTSDVITRRGQLDLVTTVTDSRGRTAQKTITISIDTYNKPEIKRFDCWRDETNLLVFDVVYAVQALNSKNTANFKVELKKLDESDWTEVYTDNILCTSDNGLLVTINEPTLSPDLSYDVRATLADWFGVGDSSAGRVQSTAVIFDLLADGKGVAFGKVAETTETVDLGWAARFSGGIRPIFLPQGSDLDTLTLPGIYASVTHAGDGETSYYANCPIKSSRSFAVEVIPSGPDGVVFQRLTVASKNYSDIFERHYYSATWGTWYRVYNGAGIILWSGALYMKADHTINLPEKISDQATGIELIFSPYASGEAENGNYVSFFVSKNSVAQISGASRIFTMSRYRMQYIAQKCLYITDSQIKGHADNLATATGSSGIGYDNKKYVLRYVIGV